MKRGLLLIALLFSALLATPAAAVVPSKCLVKTSSGSIPAVTTSTVESSIGEIIGLFKDAGFGMSAVLSTTVLRFDGTLHALSTGIGIGASYKWGNATSRFPIELGAYVAPELTVDSKSAAGSFAFLIHGVLYKGFGLGLGYTFYDSTQSALVAPSKTTLFAFVGYGLSNPAGQAAPQ